MSHFDERSGVVPCTTSWGTWTQTVDEVFIEVNVPEGTKGKDIVCNIHPNNISLSVSGKDIFKGKLTGTIIVEDSVWTLEDRKLIRIVLIKSDRNASNCWTSLLEDMYKCNPYMFDQMEKKLTLERFQNENPGFDFSSAEITGNYHKGGPDLKPN